MLTNNTTTTRPVRRSGRQPEQIPGRPYCMACHRALNKARSYKNSDSQHIPRWQCHTCKYSIKGISSDKPRPKDNGLKLLTLIDSKLRGYSVDVREDLRGEIALAILSHKTIGGKRVTASTLSDATVRAIAKPLLRAMPNRFKFVSLEHCYQEGGRRLEERLAG